jgi:hypothetical protein
MSVDEHDPYHGSHDRGRRQEREPLGQPPGALGTSGPSRAAGSDARQRAAPDAAALVRALLGQLGQLSLDLVQIVVHADPVSFN